MKPDFIEVQIPVLVSALDRPAFDRTQLCLFLHTMSMPPVFRHDVGQALYTILKLGYLVYASYKNCPLAYCRVQCIT